MDDNETAFYLDERVALKSFASKLAPTVAGSFDYRFSGVTAL
jgi:hypothetical protein